MQEMTPRERVMAFLRRETPDRVPWVENEIEEFMQTQLMGTADFDPPDLCRKLGLDGFGYHYPKGASATAASMALMSGDSFAASYHYPDRVTFDFVPPFVVETEIDSSTGRPQPTKPLLTSRDALDLLERILPDPDNPARYERVAKWIEQYRQEFAVFARIRLGASPTWVSMGLDTFSYALCDDPEFIHEIHGRFSAWSARVVRHLNEMDFDFIWANDDLAGNTGPLMSPKAFREFFLPHMKIVAQEIRKPWVFHSDGDLFPILPDLLTLGMSAIHPIQPCAMDLGRMKREYGDRVGIAGNIDLDYTLTLGTPQEVDSEVRDRIRTAGPGGGYMVTSANTITDYCKPENVWAMARAIKSYGKYPLNLR